MILEVDPVKRRISLGLKQTLQNPWEAFAEKHPVGSEVEGEVKNKTEFGLFIGLDGDVDGMVHLSDLDWNRPGEQVIEEFKKGDMVRPRFSTSTSRRSASRSASSSSAATPSREAGEIKKGQIVTCEVIEVKDVGHRGEDRRHRPDRPSSSAPSSPATAATSAPSASPPARSSTPASSSSTARRAASSSRSRRWRWPRRRRRSPSSARPIRAPRSATSWARPSRRPAPATTSREVVRSSPAARVRPGGRQSARSEARAGHPSRAGFFLAFSCPRQRVRFQGLHGFGRP